MRIHGRGTSEGEASILRAERGSSEFQREARLEDRSTMGSLSVLCGIPQLGEITQSKLSSMGFHVNHIASTKLVLDFPFDYGRRTLEMLRDSHLQLIVATWNPCKEYIEDLWDLEPRALLAGEILQKQDLAETLSEVIDRTSNGEHYRLTLGPSTLLTRRERSVLRCVARGWHNRQVAQALHIEEQTVKNTLRSVYRKLGICSHAQAALYYWGLFQQL